MPFTTGTPTGSCDIIINPTTTKGVTVRWKLSKVKKGFNMTLKSNDAQVRAEFLIRNIKAKKKMFVRYTGSGAVNKVSEVIVLPTPVS